MTVPPSRADRGAVLLEAVIAIPLLTAVAGAMAWGLALVAVSAALSDTARDAARSLARGDDEGEVRGRVTGQWPDASIDIQRSAQTVTVTVTDARGLPGGLLAGREVSLTGRGVAAVEWAVGVEP